ncbi:MAG: hypothetical protein WBA76_15195 [Phormidesmis sp.]
MRIEWDETKRQQVLSKRGIDLAQLGSLLRSPYIEDQRSEVPEQYRLIGFVGRTLLSFIVEYRADDTGEYIWAVTAWKSTHQERRDYEQQIY